MADHALVRRARAAWQGSLLAERSVVTMLVAILMVFTGLGIIIPVRALYAREVGLSLAAIGAMASSFLLFNTIGQVPFGWLTDRLGRKPLIVAGITIEVVIALLYIVVNEPWTFIGLRAVEGLAAAAIMPAARAYIGDVAPAGRLGEAYGLMGAALSGGFLLGPALGGWLSALAGFQFAFVLSAGGRLLALVLVLALVREPVVHAVQAARVAGVRLDWRAALNQRLVGAYLIGIGVGYANGIFFALWSLWLQDRGASLEMIGLTYTAFSIPSLLLTPLAGRLADRVGPLPLIVGPGLVDALLYLAYGLAANLWLIFGICLVQGLLYAFLVPALDAYIAAASPAEGRGQVQGMYNGVLQGSAFISAIVCTVLYAWGPLAPFVMCASVVGLMIVLGGLWMARTRRMAAALTATEVAP